LHNTTINVKQIITPRIVTTGPITIEIMTGVLNNGLSDIDVTGLD